MLNQNEYVQLENCFLNESKWSGLSVFWRFEKAQKQNAMKFIRREKLHFPVGKTLLLKSRYNVVTSKIESCLPTDFLRLHICIGKLREGRKRENCGWRRTENSSFSIVNFYYNAFAAWIFSKLHTIVNEIIEMDMRNSCICGQPLNPATVPALNLTEWSGWVIRNESSNFKSELKSTKM